MSTKGGVCPGFKGPGFSSAEPGYDRKGDGSRIGEGVITLFNERRALD